ncbi:MAG: MarR family transcriptional regulator [Gammaproteobacteria bacterium]|nr:MarR family transcriptional regulator [Gammaproteobacteria bacterium]
MFERCLYFNLNTLTRKVNRIWDKAFAEFDLSPAHGYLLRLVLAEPGLNQKQLAEQLNLNKSTITRFIDALEQKNLVKRKKAITEDAREQIIIASTKAKKIQTALKHTGDDLYQYMQQQLGNNELLRLVQQLKNTTDKL